MPRKKYISHLCLFRCLPVERWLSVSCQIFGGGFFPSHFFSTILLKKKVRKLKLGTTYFVCCLLFFFFFLSSVLSTSPLPYWSSAAQHQGKATVRGRMRQDTSCCQMPCICMFLFLCCCANIPVSAGASSRNSPKYHNNSCFVGFYGTETQEYWKSSNKAFSHKRNFQMR